MRRFAVFCLTLGVWAIAATSEAGEVSLTLSGTAFEGGPAFEVGLNGAVIGSGTVDTQLPEGQTFVFEIGDDVLSQAGDLTLRLTNDYFAGPGQDRSLSVLAATVGSTSLTAGNFVIVQDGAPVERDSSAGALIWSGNETAVANSPPGGWLEGTALDAAAATCTQSAEIVGFVSGSAASPVLARDAVKPLVEAAKAGNCSATITGYADVAGMELTNLRLTAARAGAVLDDLIVEGARFPVVNIVPTTGTEQFGSEGADNRRVTVQLWSPAPQQPPMPAAQPTAAPEGPVAQMASDALAADLAHIMVLGWRSNGELYVRSSNTDSKEVLWLLEQVKARLIAGDPVLGAGQ